MSCVGVHIYTRDTPSWRATANSFPCICKPMLTTRLFHKLLVYVPFFIALTLKVNNFWAFNLNKLVWITWNWHFVSQKYSNIGSYIFQPFLYIYYLQICTYVLAITTKIPRQNSYGEGQKHSRCKSVFHTFSWIVPKLLVLVRSLQVLFWLCGWLEAWPMRSSRQLCQFLMCMCLHHYLFFFWLICGSFAEFL